MENSNSKRRFIPLFFGAVLIGLLLYFGQKQVSKNNPENSDLKTEEIVQKIITEEAKNEENANLDDQVEEKTQQLSETDQKKWQELQDIIKTKNDNDPRLDQDFKNLSLDMHTALKARYAEIPAEDRSQRGLIAFLIARDLKDTDDLIFLKKVYDESPCLSLENCGSRAASDPHHSGIDQATMNYPQLVTLYQLEKQLTARPDFFKDPQNKDNAKAIIDRALKFPVPVVQKKAQDLQNRFQL